MIEALPGCDRVRLLLLHEARRLECLAQDLRAIAEGSAPRTEDLETAPVIDGWVFGQRSMTTMVGTLIGHPRLPDGAVHTTEVWAIDPCRRWARTLSRFYVLGTRRTGGGHDH
jgi:hypothetical protein